MPGYHGKMRSFRGGGYTGAGMDGVVQPGAPAGMVHEGEFVIPALLGGGKQLLFAEAIVLRINAQQDWPAAAAMSLVLMVITLSMVALLGRRIKKLGMF